MPVTIIATPNDPTANSYVTVDEFNAYALSRVPSIVWLATSTADFVAACIITGTRLFDASFDWTGAAATSTQKRPWGRSGMYTRNGAPIDPTTIPDDLKDADCEMIIAVGDKAVAGGSIAADNQAARLGVSDVKAGPVEVRFQPTDSSRREAVDVAIRRTWPELNYTSGTVPDVVRYLLPESWYKRKSVLQTITFRVS